MDLFESSIEYLVAKQEEAQQRYEMDRAERRGSVRQPNHGGGRASPRNAQG